MTWEPFNKLNTTSDELCGRILRLGKLKFRRLVCESCSEAIANNESPKHLVEIHASP